MPHAPVCVAGPMSQQESIVKALSVPESVALLSTALCLFAGIACARAAAPDPASTQDTQSATALQLQVPSQPVTETPPAAESDNAVVDAQDNAADKETHGPQIHGSVTAGIGYSKNYGTSTMEATDLDISGQSDGGTDYAVRIHLEQSKGLGFGPYGGYYGSPYRGR